MSSKKSSFGPPRLLPGQAEYGKTKTDLLEKEATEMEIKLRMLQERMADPKLMAATASAAGGNRWKSASEDKGSFRSYARDLQEKHKRKMSATYDPSAIAGRLQNTPPDNGSATGRAAGHSSSSGSRIHSAPADQWSTEDVSSWLLHLGLPQYSATFKSNEISGPVLLDLSLSDLDYLHITILGHRKTILKAVEDIKKSKSLAFVSGGGPAVAAPAKSVAMRSSDDMDAKRSTHWSDLEPLSSSVVTGKGGFANPADRDDDVFDEAAEQAAFKDAVAEWRRGSSDTSSSSSKPKVSIVRDANYEPPEQGSAKAPAAMDNSMWHNPFADSHSADLFDDSGDEDEAPAGAGRSSLLQGRLDEAEEHLEFVKAVDAWRTGAPPASSATILSLTEQIGRQLEVEQQQAERRMAQQRDEAYRKLEAYRIEAGALHGSSNALEDCGAGDFLYTSRSEPKHSGGGFSDSDSDDDCGAPGAKSGGAQHRALSVRSSLGVPDAKDVDEEEYYVDEESDHDGK